MIPLLTSEEVKQAEQRAIDDGTSEQELMLRAGAGIARIIEETAFVGANVVILCGPGKNGDDGVVIGARLVEAGMNVTAWAWNRDAAGDAPVDAAVIERIRWIDQLGDLAQPLRYADFVVDAVFGAGGKPELPEAVEEAFDLVRSAREDHHFEIVAVDLPSGMSADSGAISESALQADITGMIGLPKIGAFQMPAASFLGTVHHIDIGLPAPEGVDQGVPQLITTSAVRRILPQRRTGTHKRSAGTLMVIGGAPNYYGAPRLAGEAALRAGAGLVSVAAPSSIIGPIATAVPELTFVPLPLSEHTSGASRMASIVRERSEGLDALVIGPGLGTDAPVPDFLTQFLGFSQSGRSGIGFGSHAEPDPVPPFSGKAVMDADALNWLSDREDWWTVLTDAELVLTPHAGELSRLLGLERQNVEADPWSHAREAAMKFGQVVVLKYAHSVVATPDGRLSIASAAPVGLATAGTGDVLSGIIGALLAQGCSAEEAAFCGVGWGTFGAELVAKREGSIGYTATDLIRELPCARERIYRLRLDVGQQQKRV